MTRCRWCGDAHLVDRLCGQAQRGMTRRSFCFLVGGALAAAALPLKLAPVVPPYAVPPDRYVTLLDALQAPTTVTFRTRDAALRVGRVVTVDVLPIGRVFNGTVDRVAFDVADRCFKAHATANAPSTYTRSDLLGRV